MGHGIHKCHTILYVTGFRVTVLYMISGTFRDVINSHEDSAELSFVSLSKHRGLKSMYYGLERWPRG